MLKRFLALFVLCGLAAGFYYLKLRPAGWRTESLAAVGDDLRDTKTTAAVKTALGLHRDLKRCPIEVQTEDGVVTLRGSVSSADLRGAAERVVAAVPDVRTVVDHLQLKPAPTEDASSSRTLGETFDDEAMAVQVRLALSLRRELAGTSIDVKAFRRQVTLAGQVAAAEQKTVALATAGETAEVSSVTDRIVIGGQDHDGLSDTVVAATQRALDGNPHLKDYGLRVNRERGRLVLSGRVKTGAERDLAGLLAERTAGAVENTIDVGR